MPASLREQLQDALGDTYSIERELPRGGMSRVFGATERALGRPVVIKVLAPELAAGLSAERFKREIALAARLQHPHIVPLLTAGNAAHSVYYTMPYVDGDSLRERMSRERPMSFENVARILEEVARALDYAHEMGIVHRDIKPENVMFFHGQAVVLDFGIGKAISAASAGDDDPAAARITRSGTALGTPTYIPPEQAAGDEALDHRADIYSLGVVAYEMLCGHPPFSGRNSAVVMAAHANDTPQPLAQRRPGIPGPLARVVMQCLEKRPADRPQRAAEIVEVLRGTPPRGGVALSGGRGAGGLAGIPIWVPWSLAVLASAAALILALR
ncbi:MAG TPA: serine/threonine-protein kinase [Gemmatimonadaceae bacterium]|jgi:serine/threonine-protein kinase|nr:serine/threonine-protein kinase [Gemmatimonadaceae bacterium]